MASPTTYEDLLARARALVATTDRIPVIGISGHGGSGKSTLAEKLGADLGLAADQVVPSDCFYATTCGPHAGMWEQHDWRLIEKLIRAVRGVPAPDRLRFDYRYWTGQTGVEDHAMPPILIIEGIRLIHDRTQDWFDLTVWIDLDPETAGARAKARNLLQGDDRVELNLWDTKWIPEGHAYAAEVDPVRSADLVLSAT